METHDWVLVGILAIQTSAQIALWIDKWVHRQTDDVGTHERRLKALEQAVGRASDEGSRKHGEHQKNLGLMQLELERLKSRTEWHHEQIDSLSRWRENGEGRNR